MSRKGTPEKTQKKSALAMTPVGCHVSTAGGLPKAIERAVETGCEAFQIFVRNPRSWQVRPLEDEVIERFREERKKSGLGPVVVHTAYLINLSSPDEEIFGKSLSLFKTELEMSAAIGADFLVTHLGTPRGRGRAYAMGRVREALEDVRKALGKVDTVILFENSAHKGMTGADLEEIGEVIEIAEKTGLGAGMCFDTCHAFAAGYPVAGSEEEVRALVDLIIRSAGPGGLGLVHLNDSKGEAGSGVDRHENIGKGRIGNRALGAFLDKDGIRGVPLILETPKKEEGDDLKNLRAARRLIAKTTKKSGTASRARKK